ncbi:MAG: pitrilysin family protein [Pseudomonadota bacterium]
MHSDWFRVILSVLLSLLAGAAHAGPVIEHWNSERGGRVYFVHADDLPLVDIRVVFDAGSARDGKRYGVASLTSSLLDTGAKNWDADAIAQRLESVGARLGSGVSRDSTWLSLRCLTRPDILEQSLDTVSAILGSATFAQKDFDREKARVIAALHQREESPAVVARDLYFQALYGEHPYAHPSEGTLASAQGLTRDHIVEFYKQYYVAANAVVVIVGDVTQKQAKNLADQLLSGLPKGARAVSLPEVPDPDAGESKRVEFPSEQTHVYSGMAAMARNDPDYFPLYVGNHILGGSGLVSRISEEVREKRGLSYSAYSYFSPLLRKGPFTMGLQTRNDKVDEALAVLNRTLADFIDKGPTEEELIAAKKNITGGFVLRFDTNQKLTEYVAMIGFFGLPLDYLDTFSDKVEAVTRAQITDAFRKRIHPEKFKTVLVGGKSSETK